MFTEQQRIVMGVSLTRALKERIDEKRGDIPRSRYISRIIERHLNYKNDAEDQQIQTRPLPREPSTDPLPMSPTTRCDGDAADDR
jgi:hypothetical protein